MIDVDEVRSRDLINILQRSGDSLSSGWRRVQWMKEYIWKHEDAVIVNALVAISVASINFAIAYAIIKKANRK